MLIRNRHALSAVSSLSLTNNTARRWNSFLLSNTEKLAEEIGEPDSTKRPGVKEQTFWTGSQWLDTQGKKYDMLMARNWLHPDRPFPKNPWFVPPVPLSDGDRENIYKEYRSDPKINTAGVLAKKFNVSVLRVEAILRLKHLEKRQEKKGFTMQTGFRKSMEDLLGVKDFPDKKIKEKPYYSTAELQPQSKNVYKRRADGNYIMALSGVVPEVEQKRKAVEIVEKTNDLETNARWDFVIEDLSTGKIYMRQRDGCLRTANYYETLSHRQLFPKAFKRKDGKFSTNRQLWLV